MKQFQIQWLIKEQDHGKSVKQFLKENQISKRALTDIKFSGGDLLINGQHVNVLHLLQQGETLTVIFPVETISEQMKPEDLPLTVIYEDEYLLVIQKPPGMNTIPSFTHPTGSLANALLHYFQKDDLYATIHIVTRLDRDTSGLVLVAKNRHIHHLFSQMQQLNQVKRRYEAFCHGHLEIKKGTICAPIARKPDSIIERCVSKDGQEAITHYEVLKEYNDFSHIQLQLETGRTHQIRVHLSSIGHPLLGDTLYGGKKDLVSRQALHCNYLQFIHPITKEFMEFSIPLNNDLHNLV